MDTALAIDGTAAADDGTDYTAPISATFLNGQATVTVTITPANDTDSEPTEAITLVVNNGFGYSVGSPDTATGYILDNDAQVVTVTTLNDAAEGGNGQFRFIRTGDLTNQLVVTYTVGGTATSGTDFTALSGSVTFPAASATADVSVAATDDAGTFDPDETVTVTVASGIGYSIGSLSSASLTVRDNANHTFEADGHTGAIWYNLPWEDVDPDESTQSLPLDDFTLVFAGHKFTEATADFTTAPTAEFEDGVLVGITFGIDTSGVSGFAYSSIAGAGYALDVVVAATQQTIVASLEDHGTGTLDFTNATNNVASWKAEITLYYGPTDTYTYTGIFANTTTAAEIVSHFRTALFADGVIVNATPDGKSLTISGETGAYLTQIEYKTYTPNNGVWNYQKINAPAEKARSQGLVISINNP